MQQDGTGLVPSPKGYSACTDWRGDPPLKLRVQVIPAFPCFACACNSDHYRARHRCARTACPADPQQTTRLQARQRACAAAAGEVQMPRSRKAVCRMHDLWTTRWARAVSGSRVHQQTKQGCGCERRTSERATASEPAGVHELVEGE